MRIAKKLFVSLYFVAMAYWAHLNWYLFGLISLISVGVGFYTLRMEKRKAARLERIESSCFYQEQLIYSFQRNHKISAALKDTMQVCEGNLWLVVNQALDQIQNGWQKEGYMKEALGIIEKDYGTEPMKGLHRFLIHVEEWGGQTEDAMELLLTQLRCWKTWKYQLEARLGEQLGKLNLTVVLSGVICLSITRVLPKELQNTEAMFYQLSMTVCMSLLLGISFFFQAYLNGQERDAVAGKEENYEKLWKQLEHRRHGWRGERAKLVLERDVKKEFPQWLMDMLLRLQTENVTSAITHSIETAPEVLVIPLCRMDQELKQDALSKAPFVNFLQELEVPEIRSLMLQLFGIRNLGKQEIHEQILAMLDQGLQLDEAAQRMKLEDSLSWNGLLAAIPMFVSVLMMVLFMSYTLVLFLSNMVEGRWL